MHLRRPYNGADHTPNPDHADIAGNDDAGHPRHIHDAWHPDESDVPWYAHDAGVAWNDAFNTGHGSWNDVAVHPGHAAGDNNTFDDAGDRDRNDHPAPAGNDGYDAYRAPQHDNTTVKNNTAVDDDPAAAVNLDGVSEDKALGSNRSRGPFC